MGDVVGPLGYMVVPPDARDAVACVMLEMRKHSGLEQLIDLLTIFKLLIQAREPQPLSSPGFIPRLDARAGERINTLKKLFNLRQGWRPQDDWLPPRLLRRTARSFRPPTNT